MNRPTIVIAGDRQQFAAYRAARGLGPRDARYASSAHRLMGIPKGSEVIVTGTYRERRDWVQLLDLLDLANAKLIADPI